MRAAGRVLVVDDEPTILEFLRRYLSERGHAVLVQFARDEGYDVESFEDLMQSIGPRDLRELIIRRYDALMGEPTE